MPPLQIVFTGQLSPRRVAAETARVAGWSTAHMSRTFKRLLRHELPTVSSRNVPLPLKATQLREAGNLLPLEEIAPQVGLQVRWLICANYSNVSIP